MTLDDLKRLFTRHTLCRRDAILSPRLVPSFYALGLAGILLWAVSQLFWSCGVGWGGVQISFQRESCTDSWTKHARGFDPVVIA